MNVRFYVDSAQMLRIFTITKLMKMNHRCTDKSGGSSGRDGSRVVIATKQGAIFESLRSRPEPDSVFVSLRTSYEEIVIRVSTQLRRKGKR